MATTAPAIRLIIVKIEGCIEWLLVRELNLVINSNAYTRARAFTKLYAWEDGDSLIVSHQGVVECDAGMYLPLNICIVFM